MQKTIYVILFLIFLVLVWGNLQKVAPLIALAPTASPGEYIDLTSKEFFSVHLAMQANQFALLQICLAMLSIGLTALGIVLAVAAIWGYKEIKDIAIKTAERKIQEIVPPLVKDQIMQLGEKERGRAFFETKMEKKFGDSPEAAFQDGIEVMDKDPMEMPSEIYNQDK